MSKANGDDQNPNDQANYIGGRRIDENGNGIQQYHDANAANGPQLETSRRFASSIEAVSKTPEQSIHFLIMGSNLCNW